MNYFLTIAASDNSGGAGIQQDIKVAEDIGFWGLSAITGITVQNFKKLEQIFPVPAQILQEQIEMNLNSFNIVCIKIGAICSEKNINAISLILKNKKLKNVVLDPVFAPTQGKEFINSSLIKLFRENLLSYVDIVTPNKDELSLLSEKEILNLDQGIEAAKSLTKKYGTCVYLKGGHFNDNSIKEALITDKETSIFEKERMLLKYTHGTGCTFSTALSCFLGNGLTMKDACINASDYVSKKYQKLNQPLIIP